MNPEQFKDKLKDLNARPAVLEWAEGKTWKEFYNQCPRADWLLELYEETTWSNRKIALVKAKIVERFNNMDEYPERSKKALAESYNFAKGKISKKEFKKIAACTSFNTCYDASGLTEIIAHNCALPDIDYSYLDSYYKHQKKMADIVRSVIKISDFNL